MCRSIKTLFNLTPVANEEEIQQACLQFVRKISGYRKPAKRNEMAFNAAVSEMTGVAQRLLGRLRL